jgi:pteridine reductase
MTNQPIVLITGAAVRIGRAIASEFARAGFRVVIHHHQSQAEATALAMDLEAAFPAGHLAMAADLTQAHEREALFANLRQRDLLPSVLVNNASTYRRVPLLELDEAGLAADYAINLVAPLMLMRLFARDCQSGCIINLLDQRVATTEINTGGYGLAKKSLRDATELAALEWAPQIRVNGIAPGLVLPPPGVPAAKMERLLANVPLRHPILPEEIGRACVFLANSPAITGQILFLDGGQHLAPPVAIETLRSRA